MCLICKLNFIVGMYACIGKNIVYVGFGTSLAFRYPLGVLEHIPAGKGGMVVSLS